MSVLTKHRFTVDEYYRMAETGVLKPDACVELLEGEIIDMAPIGSFHGGSTKRLIELFTRLSKGRWIVSAQDPVRLNKHSEPQPDLMLLKPVPDFYASHHPAPDDVFLLIEVADSSLTYDRSEKLPAYGRASVAEVWILNLNERALEVYREPHFNGYGATSLLRPGEKATLLAFSDVEVEVEELLRRA